MNLQGNILLVDNSNTRTKFALATDGELTGDIRYLPTADISAQTVAHALEGMRYERAALCSVAPLAAEKLRRAITAPICSVSAASCPELLRDYPQTSTLGADRVANAAAVAADYPLPCIAVDLGTACTFDIVIADEHGSPRFAGGIIAPGLETLRCGLSARTELLPLTDPVRSAAHEPAPIGVNTQQALRAGLYYGYKGMVEGIIRTLQGELGGHATVVLTGGDARLWENPTWADVYDKNLTFNGMLKIYASI